MDPIKEYFILVAKHFCVWSLCYLGICNYIFDSKVKSIK
jgi:hypothetical protein